MSVSVEYLDEEPSSRTRQWKIVKLYSHQDEASRSGSLTDSLVKQMKRKAAQQRFERVKTGDEELTNVLHFNYLEVM